MTEGVYLDAHLINKTKLAYRNGVGTASGDDWTFVGANDSRRPYDSACVLTHAISVSGGFRGMTPLKDNVDVASFLVTKHSWKGKYRRVLGVGTAGVTTYNPDRLDITNRWSYSEVVGMSAVSPLRQVAEFTLTIRRDRKQDTIRFSSEHRNIILTEVFKYRHMFADKPSHTFVSFSLIRIFLCFRIVNIVNVQRCEAYKHHWSDTKLPVVLEVTPCSLDQLDPVTNTPLASYSYYEIEGIIGVEDYPGGFVIACGGFSRLHLFASSRYNEIKTKIIDSAVSTLGINIKVLPTKITLDEFQNQRFGKYRFVKFINLRLWTLNRYDLNFIQSYFQR